jgi:hypothetical protein
MAILEDNSGGAGLQIDELCPEGTYVAVIGRIDDSFGVKRPKFENPTETELVDETRFTFGVTVNNTAYRVQTFSMRISGSLKSNLMKFLTALMGKAPKLGWDYCTLKGTGCVITVAHKVNRDGTKTYANITGIRPVRDSLNDYTDRVPSLSSFVWDEDAKPASPPVTAAAPVQAPAQPAPPPVEQPRTQPIQQPAATQPYDPSTDGEPPF